MSGVKHDQKNPQKPDDAPRGPNWGPIGGILLTGVFVVPALLIYFSTANQARVLRLLAIDIKSQVAVDPIQRLLFALRWLAPICLTVVIGVQIVASCRLLSPAIDGKTPHWLTDIWRSVLQNTFEQAFIMTLNLLALSQNIRPEQLALIPMLVALFVVGRIVFAIGYTIAPTRRALGFMLTFLPSVLFAIYNVYCLVSSLIG